MNHPHKLLGRWRQAFAIALTAAAIALPHPSQAADAIKVRIGWQASMQALLYLAREHKLHEQVGLDAEYIRFNAGPPMFAALRSGDVDIAYMGAPPAAIAIAQGIPVKAFVSEVDASNSESLVVHNDGGIDSLADLKGKKIAIWRGSSAEFALRKAMALAGLTDDDLEILDVDVSTVVPAFEKKDLDGVYIWDPWAYRLQQRNGKQIVTDADVGIRMPALWIGREDWLANPEAGKRFVQAMQMAHVLMGKDTEAAAVLTGEVLGVDTEVARDLITRTGYPTVEEQADPDNVLSVHPDTIAKGEGLARVLTDIAEFFKSNGRVDSVPDMTQKIDSGPVMLATGG